MKNVNYFIILVSVYLLIIIWGCSENNSMSFIDDYDVDLTEDKGTVYYGDYFPLYENYTCNYSGYGIIHTKINIPGYGEDEETSSGNMIGMQRVLPQTLIPLNSGSVMLYPVVEASEFDYEFSSDTSRFYMKDEQAVYVKAVKLSDGSYLEVEDPVFIKSALKVGESWMTAPKFDMTELLMSALNGDESQTDMSVDAKSKFFVAGHQMITLPVGNRRALRLEQANDIKVKGTMNLEGYTYIINISAEIAIVYHLIADTGIVHQNMTGPMNMKITVEGQSMTMNIDIEQSELSLTGINSEPYFPKNDSPASGYEIFSDEKFPVSEKKMIRLAGTFKDILIKNLAL